MTTWQITSIVIFLLWLILFISTLLSSKNDYKVTKYHYIVVAIGDNNIYYEHHIKLNFKVKCNLTYAQLKFEVAKQIERATDEFIILNYKYLGRNKI